MGTFDPTSPGIIATDDPAIAKAHGLTEWDDERGQYVAPDPDMAHHGPWSDESADVLPNIEPPAADAAPKSKAKAKTDVAPVL